MEPPHSTALIDRLRSALVDRYAIERELGAGGMATVYLAEDLKHGRKVAIKVLRPDLADALGPDRFLREIRLAARLAHPHVLPLLDSGEVPPEHPERSEEAGILYYVMPFVQGESLRDRMRREGPLPLADSTAIATEVAGALGHAHERGIVHRDVKPENILLMGGQAVVADFGIARPADDGATRLTETGLALGTPAYMSPEQLTGDNEIDGRSDIYGLACVVYEMLTGAAPFHGATAHALMARRLTAPPPRVGAFRDGIPPAVDRALLRAMAPDPDARYASMATFAAALRGEDTPVTAYMTAEFLAIARTPFVGRTRECAELGGRLDQLTRGVGGLVLIGGEPGVGKTRLADWVLGEARLRRALALVGHCGEMEGAGPPFQPFVEQIEAAMRIVPRERLRHALGDAAPDLTRLTPALRQLFPDLPPPLELPPEQQRQHLFRCYREFIERAAWVQPIVALFDDLHWADESSLLLLEQLAQHLHALPLLAIGTYRDVELDVNRPFARSLERLTRQRSAARMSLGALPETDVAALFEALAGQPAPGALVAVINRETEGNPFFCEEVFRHLTETGRLFDAEGRWRSELDLAELEVPEGVRLVIGRRLERSSEACRATLATAAVIGPRFEVSLLEAAGEVSGDALLDALEEAERGKLVRVHAAGRTPVYGFAHELIRATLLAGLSLPRRQRRHARIADAIERLTGERARSRVAALAYHCYQAGATVELDRTIGYQVAAATEALGAGAFEEALRLAEQALSLEEERGTRREGELLRLRGTALRSLGRWPAAIECWERALDVFERLRDVEAAARLAIDVGWLVAYEAEYARALRIAERGLEFVRAGHTRERALLLILAGNLRATLGDYDGGMGDIRAGTRLGHEIGDVNVTLIARYFECSTRWFYCRLAEERAHIDPVDLTAPPDADPFVLADLWGVQYIVLTYGGDFEAADRLRPPLEALAARVGHLGAGLNLAHMLAAREWARTGDLDGLAAATRSFLERFGALTWGAIGHLYEAIIEFYRGNWRHASERVDAVASTFPSSRFGSGFANGPAALIAAYAARVESIHLDRLVAGFSRQPPELSGEWAALLCTIEACAASHRRAEAAALYPLALQASELGLTLVAAVLGIAETRVAIAAACAERWADAERHFENSLRQANELPYVVAHPETRRWYAWMLLDRDQPGDRARARQLLAEAIEGYRRIGMPRHVELAEGLAARAAPGG